MEIAVVGGGLFGLTVATKATQEYPDANVDVFEKSDDILQGASEINQCRLHRGYHYPRSEATAISCRESERKFRAEYPDAIVEDHDHYYGIAAEKTKTTPKEFISHCERIGLEYEEVDISVMQDDAIDLCLEVDEDQIDPLALREILRNRIESTAAIDVHLNYRVPDVDDLDGYDYVVVATYGNNNSLVSSYPDLQRDYKFQVIEKPVATLPEQFHGKSLIVLDGPFMGVDPFSDTGQFHLDHVVHGVRHSNVGKTAELGDIDPELLNRGLVEDVPDSNFPKFVDHGSKFYRGIEEAEHLGSKFTVRAVLPDVEETDARPTIVDREENVFSIFSGKLATCVTAAERVLESIDRDER